MIHIKGLAHETSRLFGHALQDVNQVSDFLLGARRLNLHQQAHGPHHVLSSVWAADTACKAALKEPRVPLGEHKVACVLVEGVVLVNKAQHRQTQQWGRVGVVHHQLRAKAIHFKCKHLAKDGVIHHGVLVNRSTHYLSQLFCPDAHVVLYVEKLAFSLHVRRLQIELNVLAQLDELHW